MQNIELNIKSNQLLLSYTFFPTKIKKYFNNVKIGALCTSTHQSNRMSVSLCVCLFPNSSETANPSELKF